MKYLELKFEFFKSIFITLLVLNITFLAWIFNSKDFYFFLMIWFAFTIILVFFAIKSLLILENLKELEDANTRNDRRS